jgi:heptaprenyl diphosphate synthase
MKVKRLAELSVLTALALIIFVIELQIPNPVPIPGVKLGLANIITVFAVYHYRARDVFLIVFARILLGAFFSGNIMALMYSMAGGILCLIGMVGLKHLIPERYIWIYSVLGAVLHNIGQITVACLIAGWGLLVYLPFLVVSGCIAGAFTGMCSQLTIRQMKTISLKE